ncbi:glycoside hydrolase family 97 protein [Pedobacter duraquae]|uniref:Glycosyl hydrolase family 97 n=1 Tax=Pedobacter duraquae TaxID=425511 RepID=A0A4R6IQK0_9SPHI|nr:glycoside hydrolase family 97 protein [Pedobacter duraquae]TDO24609.1 glycosyl hydrolase family 97 [Pedobacter duraquae]
MKPFFTIALILISLFSRAQSVYTVASPNKKIVLTCDMNSMSYTVAYDAKTVLRNSRLGLIRADQDFSKTLKVVKVSNPSPITDSYTMVNAKRSHITYRATQRIIETEASSGKRMNIIFRVSDDGVALQYEFPEHSSDIKKITAEATTFHFLDGTRAWLQPKAQAQTGFEHTNPSYEDYYQSNIPTGTPSPGSNGWVYPALFKSGDIWIMITEAALGTGYSGTSLQQHAPDSEYKINFPQPAEVFTNGKATLMPESILPWKSPWRIIALGDLKTIAESTLGTDLALPQKKMDFSFVKPGKASWSWILKKDDSTVYHVQKKYIDLAANMKWNYCLLDANWDQLIGYDSVKILADYAKKKDVGLLLWYNSAGSWNTVKFTPKDKLLTHADRMAEFARLRAMGIKGLKIDFFAGDGQSMMNYYHDILEDAASNQLMVNFHGATLPRGLQRTYPNLMTTEAVHGYEMITFSQGAANRAPEHMALNALIRNNFDPMDFTPMNLYRIPNIKRATTPAFELATAVVFLSGIQHYAESPEGMSHVSEPVKDFLRTLPDSWDDVRFIDADPGKSFILARQSGNKWYVAGLNAENKDKNFKLDLSFLKGHTGSLITSVSGSTKDPDFAVGRIKGSKAVSIDVHGNDGFVIVFDK